MVHSKWHYNKKQTEALNDNVPIISQEIIHDDDAYVITYTAGVDNKITHFRFFCGETEFDESRTTCNQLETSPEEPEEYYLELYSSTICNIEPSIPPSTSKSGLSGGSIFVIWYT